jgi:hypothetical protein
MRFLQTSQLQAIRRMTTSVRLVRGTPMMSAASESENHSKNLSFTGSAA